MPENPPRPRPRPRPVPLPQSHAHSSSTTPETPIRLVMLVVIVISISLSSQLHRHHSSLVVTSSSSSLRLFFSRCPFLSSRAASPAVGESHHGSSGCQDGSEIYWGQLAPQELQDLVLPSKLAPHLGQDELCMLAELVVERRDEEIKRLLFSWVRRGGCESW